MFSTLELGVVGERNIQPCGSSLLALLLVPDATPQPWAIPISQVATRVLEKSPEDH